VQCLKLKYSNLRQRIQNLKILIKAYKGQASVLVGSLVLPLIFSGMVAKFVSTYYHHIEQLTLIETLSFIVFAAFPLAFSIFPNTVACLVLGYLFGWEAIAWLLIMYGVGLVVGYVIGLLTKTHQPASLSNFAGAEFWLSRLQHSHKELTFLSRFSPVLSFAATNMVLVWLGVRFNTYWIYSILGMLPRMLILVWIAMGVKDIIDMLQQGSTPDQWLISIGFMVVGVGGYAFIWLRVKKRNG
jgi:uncharacterized membrane protein YdjX (TVP38/TMEM64 family)